MITKNSKIIIVEPVGGLGNRMRVIASAYALANVYQYELKIIWNVNAILKAEFSDCFQKIANTQVLNRGSFLYYFQKMPQLIGRSQENIEERVTINKMRALYQQGYRESEFKSFFDNIVQTYSTVYIESDFDFYPHNFNFFLPNCSISKAIARFQKLMPSQIIGIHIRQTDHHISKTHSTVEKFIEVIEKEIENNPVSCFFLATDELAVQHQLIQKFGSKIIYYSENKSRNSKNGIRQAIVDLFLLSKTSKIYGSYWSSFSEVASKIGGIELIIVK
ncbi:MAG: hypothetical protein OHK0053_04740 [Microscillaceae bacterium]